MFETSLLFSKFKAYCYAPDGNFAIWAGIAAFPLITAVSFAVDFNGAERARIELKSALDSASLAAVTNQNITPASRAVYAETYFEKNFSQSKYFDLEVRDASASRVELVATGGIPTTVSRSIGMNKIDIIEDSVAVLTKQNPICVLTLDPEGEGAFFVQDGSSFLALNCAVQVNSNHEKAAIVDVYSDATAKSFCTVGGSDGKFLPFVNTECSAVPDPFLNIRPPDTGTCINDGKTELRIQQTVKESRYGNVYVNEVVSVVGDTVTLRPGTYCGKLRVDGYNVTFLPGTYIMRNAELEFKKGASAVADGVTFVMHGRDAKVTIEQGSSLIVKAPKTGPYAGMAFYQNAEAALTNGKGKPRPGKFPTAISELKGGSSMNIVGTVYLPTQEIKVGSDSGLGTNAPATSFIGYRVGFEGGAKIKIEVNYASEGLPPILPLSDESARLVR